MAMFGNGLTTLQNGLKAGPYWGTPPYAPDNSDGPFGSGVSPTATPPYAAGTPASQPSAGGMFGNLSLANKAGLIGDILAQHPVFTPIIQQQRAEQLAFAKQNNLQAQEYQRQLALAQWKASHPEPTDFDQALTAAGITPGDPRWAKYHEQKVQNDVDPVHAYPTTDAAGNQGLVFKRPSEMSAGSPVQIKGASDYNALPPGTPYIDPNGQHRVKGGAAPATGPGGFPLYPAGH